MPCDAPVDCASDGGSQAPVSASRRLLSKQNYIRSQSWRWPNWGLGVALRVLHPPRALHRNSDNLNASAPYEARPWTTVAVDVGATSEHQHAPVSKGALRRGGVYPHLNRAGRLAHRQIETERFSNPRPAVRRPVAPLSGRPKFHVSEHRHPNEPRGHENMTYGG